MRALPQALLALILMAPTRPAQAQPAPAPSGTLSGRVQVKAQQEPPVPLPQRLSIRRMEAPGAASTATANAKDLECPVDAKGRWSCSLPAATYDLTLSAAGFAPISRIGVVIEAGKERSLGTLALQKGGSVSAWIELENGTPEAGVATARLIKLGPDGQPVTKLGAIEPPKIEQKVGAGGFLQVAGVPAGTYDLMVEMPGYTRLFHSPVDVAEAKETVIDGPLVLRRPFPLEFAISPPVDWRDEPWRVLVLRADEAEKRAPLVFNAKANPDGRFTVPDQSAGHYRVDVMDSENNTLLVKQIEVAQPQAAPQRLEVEWLFLEGSLRIGETPLAEATLYFGGILAPDGDSMRTDEQGQFKGVLARAGEWHIDIESQEAKVHTSRREQIRSGPSRKARLDLVLPDTYVFGNVKTLDPELELPNARVTLESATLTEAHNTDYKGEFELRGIPEGPVWISARFPGLNLASDRPLINVVAGEKTGPIELRLRKGKTVTGRVTGPAGPVAGARVTFLVRDPPGIGGGAMTGAEGELAADVVYKNPRFHVTVAAPGFGLRAFEASAEGQPLAFSVSEASGTLEVARRLVKDAQGKRTMGLVIEQDGVILAGPVLDRWSAENGGTVGTEEEVVRFPKLAPGRYRVCILPLNLGSLVVSTGIPETFHCARGILGAGTTLSLDLMPKD